jgi:hypothetical protein
MLSSSNWEWGSVWWPASSGCKFDDRDCYLKLGKFEAADKGRMELYLGWLKRYACEPEEAEPLAPILCAGKSEEHIALLGFKSAVSARGWKPPRTKPSWTARPLVRY